MNQCGIYNIINKVNGKRYVGSTSNWYQRKAHHLSDLRAGKHHNAHLQNAWNKYGEDAFIWEWVLDVPEYFLLQMEQMFIDANPDGYNIAIYADAPMRGRNVTDETRAKLSKAGKGKKRNEETKARISQSRIGIKHTEETKKKMSESCMGRKCSEETKRILSEMFKGKRDGINNPMYGKRHSEEIKCIIGMKSTDTHFGRGKGYYKHKNQFRVSVSYKNKRIRMCYSTEQEAQMEVNRIRAELKQGA